MSQQAAIVIERFAAVLAIVRRRRATIVDMRVQMIVERDLGDESPTAHVTQVRPFTDVRLDVIDQRGLAAERARTMRARQRLHAGVRAQMVAERARLAERFAAHVTLVRSVAGVHASVYRQRRRVGKSFTAHVARRRRRHYRTIIIITTVATYLRRGRDPTIKRSADSFAFYEGSARRRAPSAFLVVPNSHRPVPTRAAC